MTVSGRTSVVRGRGAFTFVELLIAISIMLGLSLVLFQVLSGASRTRAMATAKGTAKGEVEIAMRQIAQDIARARAPTIADYENGRRALEKITGGNGVIFKISEPTANGVNEVEVKYTWDLAAKTLIREAAGVRHPYTTHLATMSIDYAGTNPETGVAAASGTVLIVMGTLVKPEGNFPPQAHTQEMMVTIQEEMRKNMDGKWRKTEDIISKF